MTIEPIAGGPVAELRAAAERLRELGREHPRGPWRWGDADRAGRPDEPDEPEDRWPWPGGPGPGGPHLERSTDPSASFADLVRGRAQGRPLPAGPPGPAGTPSGTGIDPPGTDTVIDPALAGPLADLLEALADRAATEEPPVVDAEPLRSALRVAAALRR